MGALLTVVLAGACTPGQKADPGADAGAAPDAASPLPVASTSANPAEPPEPRGGDEIRPVYPADAGAPDPLATRFCEAVLVTPERRRSECCATPNVAAMLSGSCVRMLTFALGQHAVTLAPADVDRCAEAMNRATAGCDWVTPDTSALPPECDGIVKGALAAKAQCRSSLECQDGLRCVGLSAIDLGTCAPPKPARAQCNIGVDTLATFTRQDHLDRTHPECEGYCGRSQCEPAVAAGAACATERACGAGAHCIQGKCSSAPLPALGEPCTEACAVGARCVKGKCAAPKAESDPCDADAECRGACVRGDGGAAGACVKSCPVFTVPHSPAAPVRPIGKPGVAPPRRR